MNNKDYIEHMNKYIPTISIDEIRNIAIRFRGDNTITVSIDDDGCLIIRGNRYNVVTGIVDINVIIVKLSIISVPYLDHDILCEDVGCLRSCGLTEQSGPITKLLLNFAA